MALFGFEFTQTLQGSYHRIESPGDEKPMSITVRAEVHDAMRLWIDPRADLSGEIDAEGLADHKPTHGTLDMNVLMKKKLVYELRFPDNDGAEHRFHGEIEVEPLRLGESLTTLAGSIFATQGEREVARVVLRFDVKDDLFKLLKSFRPR